MSSAEKRDTGLFQPALPDVDPVHVTGKQGDYLFRVLIEKRADHFYYLAFFPVPDGGEHGNGPVTGKDFRPMRRPGFRFPGLRSLGFQGFKFHVGHHGNLRLVKHPAEPVSICFGNRQDLMGSDPGPQRPGQPVVAAAFGGHPAVYHQYPGVLLPEMMQHGRPQLGFQQHHHFWVHLFNRLGGHAWAVKWKPAKRQRNMGRHLFFLRTSQRMPMPWSVVVVTRIRTGPVRESP